MTKTTKIIDRSKKYLSDVLTYLPSNCLFDKGITGCGGTFVELNSKRHSIICVPTVSLVENKSDQVKIFGVTSSVKDGQIKKYISDISNIYNKIVVTYDSLPRVINILGKSNAYENYFLLIDEYHILFVAYAYRDEAIRTVLKEFVNFKNFCFMTATPLTKENTLCELKDLDVVSYDWAGKVKVKVDFITCRYTIMELKKHIYVSEQNDYNLHIFLNSVKTINQLVKELEIKDYRVICSKTATKRNKSINVVSVNSEVKKINFYTATAFEGVDILDPKGKTIVISDSSISTTMLDISTLLIQICGRLRNSIYKDEITFIVNPGNHRYLRYESEEEFNLQIEENELDGKERVNKFNSSDEQYKRSERKVYSDKFKDIYVIMEDDTIVYDENLKLVDIDNYKIINKIYTNTLNVLKEMETTETFITERVVPLGLKDKSSITEMFYEQLNCKFYTFKELQNILEPILIDFDRKFTRTCLNQYGRFEMKKVRVDNKQIKLYKPI